jgi:hypothetical protein
MFFWKNRGGLYPKGFKSMLDILEYLRLDLFLGFGEFGPWPPAVNRTEVLSISASEPCCLNI